VGGFHDRAAARSGRRALEVRTQNSRTVTGLPIEVYGRCRGTFRPDARSSRRQRAGNRGGLPAGSTAELWAVLIRLFGDIGPPPKRRSRMRSPPPYSGGRRTGMPPKPGGLDHHHGPVTGQLTVSAGRHPARTGRPRPAFFCTPDERGEPFRGGHSCLTTGSGLIFTCCHPALALQSQVGPDVAAAGRAQHR